MFTPHPERLRRGASLLALAVAALATVATSEYTCELAQGESKGPTVTLSAGETRSLTLETRLEGGSVAWKALGRLEGEVSAPAAGPPCEVVVYLRRRGGTDPEVAFAVSVEAGQTQRFSGELADLAGDPAASKTATYDLTFVAKNGTPTIASSARVLVEPSDKSKGCPDATMALPAILWGS